MLVSGRVVALQVSIFSVSCDSLQENPDLQGCSPDIGHWSNGIPGRMCQDSRRDCESPIWNISSGNWKNSFGWDLPKIFQHVHPRMLNKSSIFLRKHVVFKFQVTSGDDDFKARFVLCFVLSITPAQALKFDPVMMVNSRPGILDVGIFQSYDSMICVSTIHLEASLRCQMSMTTTMSMTKPGKFFKKRGNFGAWV